MDQGSNGSVQTSDLASKKGTYVLALKRTKDKDKEKTDKVDLWIPGDSFYWSREAVDAILGLFYRAQGKPEKAAAALAKYDEPSILGMIHLPTCDYGGVDLEGAFHLIGLTTELNLAGEEQAVPFLISVDNPDAEPVVISPQ